MQILFMRMRCFAAHGADSRFFFKCQQVKLADNTTLMLLDKISTTHAHTHSSPSSRTLMGDFKALHPIPFQPPPAPPPLPSHFWLLTLIQCNRALQFKELGNTPSALKQEDLNFFSPNYPGLPFIPSPHPTAE